MFKYLAVAKVLLRKHRPSVDNFVLHMHYRITFLIFMIASSLVMAKEFLGKPISCLTKGTIPGNVLDIYCFIMSTFSVPRHYAKPLGEGVPFAGVGLATDEDEIVYHAYYQWVPLLLFIQGMLFYAPRYFWKSAEGGLFEVVLGGLNKPVVEQSKRAKQHKVLSKYIIQNLSLHNKYAASFFLVELLAFANVVANLFLTNKFLGGTFFEYGPQVIDFVDTPDINRTDPMVKIFPTISKCNFRTFGPSGTVEVHDTMCVLAVNILNQKVYILLWFWLLILAVVTGLWILYRLATIFLPPFRLWLLKVRAQMAGYDNLSRIQQHCELGDWFLLHQLGRVLEPSVYAEFLQELANQLENMPPKGEAVYPMLQ